MPVESPSRYLTLFWVIAGIAIVVGALGLADIRNAPYSGFFTNRNAAVIRVFDGSPAADAGFELGDVLKTAGGIPVDQTKALARRPRAQIGETRAYEIERAGEPMTLELVFERQPVRNRITFSLGFFVGLSFLVFTLWAYQKVPRTSSLLLALFGLSFGIAFLPGPYSPSHLLRTLGGAMATTSIILGFAFLIHFLHSFPKRLSPIDAPWAKKLIYGPAILVAAFFFFQIVFQPDLTSLLRQMTGVIAGLFVVGYFGWSLVTMLRIYRGSTPEERGRDGVSLMLAGALAGLLPVTISAAVTAVAPDILLPGAQYYSLTLGLIPIAFALATVRHQRAVATG